jgi:hypothetical protein
MEEGLLGVDRSNSCTSRQAPPRLVNCTTRSCCPPTGAARLYLLGWLVCPLSMTARLHHLSVSSIRLAQAIPSKFLAPETCHGGSLAAQPTSSLAVHHRWLISFWVPCSRIARRRKQSEIGGKPIGLSSASSSGFFWLALTSSFSCWR